MKQLLSDERAEDIKDDLQVEPNFPGVAMKPRLPTRTPTVAVQRAQDVVLVKTESSNKAMVALRLPLFAARQLAMKGGEAPEDLHCTLVYLGEASAIDSAARKRLHDALARVCATSAPLEATVAGCGRFRPDPEGEDVLWAGLDSPALPELRHRVLQACRDAAVEPAGDHGFTPHVSLAWVPQGEGEDSLPPEIPVVFKYLALCIGGDEVDFKFQRALPDSSDEKPQEAVPFSYSELQHPVEPAPFQTMQQLEAWAVDKGDLIVRCDVPAVPALVVKKGEDVSIAIEGVPAGELVRLDDLVVAMKRVHHDYIVYGWIAAKKLADGAWDGDVNGALGDVLLAREVGMPVFLGCDLLALDGDLTATPALERFELMRAMLAVVGGHAMIPTQALCSTADDLERIVDQVMDWKPSEGGSGLEPLGVTVVRADSPYTHGVTDDETRLQLRHPTRKAWSDEAREAAAEARRQHAATHALPEHRAGIAAIQAAGARYDGVQESGTARGEYLQFTDRETGSTMIIKPELATEDNIRAKLENMRASFKSAVGKEFAFGAGPGVGTEPADWQRRIADEKDKPNFLQPEKKSVPAQDDPDDAGDDTDAGNPKRPDRGAAIEQAKNMMDRTAEIVGDAQDPPQGWSPDLGFGPPTLKDAAVAAGVFGTPGTAGILAPEQGMFRRPRKQFLQVPIDKDWGTSYGGGYGAGQAIIPVSTVPRKKPRDSDNRDAGGPLWPSYGRPGDTNYARKYGGQVTGGGSGDGDSFAVGPGAVGGHTFVVGRLRDGQFEKDPDFERLNPYEALFRRAVIKVGWTDEAREAAAATRTASAMRHKDADKLYGVPMRDAHGQTWVTVDGNTYSGDDHGTMGDQLFFKGKLSGGTRSGAPQSGRTLGDVYEKGLNAGAVRATVRPFADEGSHVDVELSPFAGSMTRENAAAMAMQHGKTSVTVDFTDPTPGGDGTVTKEFTRRGEAVEYIRRYNAETQKSVPAEDDPTVNPDSKKPRKFPDVGEELGFNDTYDSKQKEADTEADIADGPILLSKADMGADAQDSPTMKKRKSVGVMWAVDEPLVVEALPDLPGHAALLKHVDGRVRLGKCYQQAAYVMMDQPPASVVLVHGTISIGQQKSQDGAGVPIAHAWVEILSEDYEKSVVYDGVQGVLYHRADYYEKMRAVAEQVYNASEACAMMLQHKHFGPWAKTAGVQSGRRR